MQKKDVKRNLLEHSEVKVQLLGEYLKRYLSIISNLGYNEKIKIFDLFCGEGEYDNGGEGSPLVILRTIRELNESGAIKKMPPIDCQFNDIKKDKIDKLKKTIEEKSLHSSAFGQLQFTEFEYKDEVGKLIDVLPKLKKGKAFIFIDPYGYKEISASDIKGLLKNKNAEVLLFLPTQFMYRFNNSGTPESLKDFIDELTEYKEWKETDSVWDFIEQLKDGFRRFLGDEYFVDTFTIQKDPATVFCLFFFSSHIKGFEKMLEAKWKIDQDEGKGWEYSTQTDLFSPLKINVLEEKLKEFMKMERSNGEVYEFTLRCGFLPKHTVEIFTEWQKKGYLMVESFGNEKARKGAFYISYENYRDNHQKIKLKRV